MDITKKIHVKYLSFDLNSNIGNDMIVEYHTDISKSVECFGKVSWIGNKQNIAKVYIATNFSIDILYQSLFWLALIFLIPKSKIQKYSINNKSILLIILLVYIHLKGEGTYYKIFSREFDFDIISKEFNGDFYYKNYFFVCTHYFSSFNYVTFTRINKNEIL